MTEDNDDWKKLAKHIAKALEKPKDPNHPIPTWVRIYIAIEDYSEKNPLSHP